MEKEKEKAKARIRTKAKESPKEKGKTKERTKEKEKEKATRTQTKVKPSKQTHPSQAKPASHRTSYRAETLGDQMLGRTTPTGMVPRKAIGTLGAKMIGSDPNWSPRDTPW